MRFGVGASHAVADEVRALGSSRVLILSTPQQVASAMRAAENLGPLAAGIFSKAAMHTPTEITVEALAHVAAVRADCLVAVGGGSTTGLGKTIALRTDLRQVVVPTTYAGSEATAVAFNETAVADLLAPVAQAMDGATALRDLGMIEADLDRVTVIATRNPYWNPRPVDPVPLRALLQRAWAGAPPVA